MTSPTSVPLEPDPSRARALATRSARDRRRAWWAAPFVAALLLAGCSTGLETGPAADPAEGTSDSTSTDAAAGTDEAGAGSSAAGADEDSDAMADDPTGDAAQALVLDAVDLDGAVVEVQVTGPTVLWFWAPWCPNCRAEAPTVAAVAADSGVTFLGVAGRDDLAAMRDFVTETGTGGFGHVADLDGALWQQFQVASQPAFAFVDGQGEVSVHIGTLGEDALRDRIADL